MDEQGNSLERDLSLCVVLPGGLERKALVHGSKPVMDLLVTLCASYHLNPSDYTVEVLSPNKNNISFKPNSPIGSLEAEKIVLKPKGVEEKIRVPYMPEATVRLLINYNKSHKAVVRVNPRLPLEMLLPVVCDKCEFNVETTVLLRDCHSTEPLDVNRSLNDHGLREVFARDTAVKDPENHQQYHNTPESVTPTESMSPTPAQDLPKKEKKQKENMGFFSLFRRKKKKNFEQEKTASAPASPGLNKPVSGNASNQALSSCNNVQVELPKKRRAPQPPMGVSQSVPNNLSTCHLRGAQSSAESTLRSTKRRAPQPPCANTQQQEDTQVKGTVDTLNTLEELRESDDSGSISPSASSSSSPCLSKPRSSSCSSRPLLAHLHHVAHPYLPSFRGKDISDARCALANILTSSVSKGILVKRMRNSATFPKLHNGSLFVSGNQQCPDDDVCTELESVLNSKLPTEPEWEDPAQKKGMTTFKVVPVNKNQSEDPELHLKVSDQCQKPAEDNESKTNNNEGDTEEDSCSHDQLETETALPDQELLSEEFQALDLDLGPDSQKQLASRLPEVEVADERMKDKDEGKVTTEVTPDVTEEPPSGVQISSDHSEGPPNTSKDEDHSNSDADNQEIEGGVEEEEQEEEERDEEGEEEEEDGFPPPPPPVYFNEDSDVVEKQREDTTIITTSTTTTLSSPHPTSPVCDRQTESFSEDHLDQCSTAMSAAVPQSPVPASAAPSKFAQAVALAVQRSRLQSQGMALGPLSSPCRTLSSTQRSTYQYGA